MSEEDDKQLINEDKRRRLMQLAGMDEETIDYSVQQLKESKKQKQKENLQEAEGKEWKSGSDCHNTDVERKMPDQLYEELDDLEDEEPMEEPMDEPAMSEPEMDAGPEGGAAGGEGQALADAVMSAVADAVESVTGEPVDVEGAGGEMDMDEPMDEPMEEPEMGDMDDMGEEPDMDMGEEPVEEPMGEPEEDDLEEGGDDMPPMEEEVEITEEKIEEAVNGALENLFSNE